MTASTSVPAMTADIASSWPGRSASQPKTSRAVCSRERRGPRTSSEALEVLSGSAQGVAVTAHPTPDEQGDDGTDDAADDAGRLQRTLDAVLVEQDVTEEATDEAADDPEQDRAADAHR